jgi:hypothetical protein
MVFNVELIQSTGDLIERCKSEYEKAESVIHRFGHMTRTAQGAAWFCTVFGGTERDEQLAYIAGMLHDIVRPITEEVCHAQASAEKALEILRDYPGITESEKRNIYYAIRDHRKPVAWKSPLHQSVYLSDKILEHMGAYLDFRAPVWAGELSHSDFHELEPLEAVLQYYDIASDKFLTGVFPGFLVYLIDYQVNWNKRYVEALKSNEDWAVDMAEQLFLSGRKKEDFEIILASFKPKGVQRKWADEMREYIKGKKFNHFRKLIG